MNKGLVKAWTTKEQDYYRLLFKGIILIVGLVGMLAIGYSAGLQRNYDEAQEQVDSIRESFADGRPFTLFGEYRIWRSGGREYCYKEVAR